MTYSFPRFFCPFHHQFQRYLPIAVRHIINKCIIPRIIFIYTRQLYQTYREISMALLFRFLEHIPRICWDLLGNIFDIESLFF